MCACRGLRVRLVCVCLCPELSTGVSSARHGADNSAVPLSGNVAGRDSSVDRFPSPDAEDAVAPHVCGCCRPLQDQLVKVDETHAQMQEDETALENNVALEAKLNQVRLSMVPLFTEVGRVAHIAKRG
eukprot:1617913-Amphidinium_carterae.1